MTTPISSDAFAGGPVTPILSLAPPRASQWLVVNDNVMGGRSIGELQLAPNGLIFAGSLNTSGGGFSSIRSRSLDVALSPFEGLAIRVRGDGRDYACDLRESATVSGSGVAWKTYFSTAPNVSVDLWLPFVAFEPTWRGTVVRQRGGGAEPTYHRTIQSVGFTIADKQDGPFRLEITGIGAY